MRVGKSAYYDWLKRPAKIISVEKLQLRRLMKQLFERSRDSLGSRGMAKKLREEGFKIGRYRVRKLMKELIDSQTKSDLQGHNKTSTQ